MPRKYLLLGIAALWGGGTGLMFWIGAHAWDATALFLFKVVGILAVAVFVGVAFVILSMFFGAAVFRIIINFIAFPDEATQRYSQAMAGCLAIPLTVAGAILAALAGVAAAIYTVGRGGEPGNVILQIGLGLTAAGLLLVLGLVRSHLYLKGFLPQRQVRWFGLLLAVVVGAIAVTAFGLDSQAMRRIVTATLVWGVAGALLTVLTWGLFVWPSFNAALRLGDIDLPAGEQSRIPAAVRKMMLRLTLIFFNLMAVGVGIDSGALCGCLAMTLAVSIELLTGYPLTAAVWYWIPAGIIGLAFAGISVPQTQEPPVDLPEPQVISGTAISYAQPVSPSDMHEGR